MIIEREEKIFMKKSTVKIISVLGALVICLTAFAACSGEDNSQKLLYEEGGKIYYRPEIGEAAYELATDADGVTRVDEQGNLLWKVTDADGNDQTHPVSYPSYLVDGKSVSCQQFTITMPRGWSNIGHDSIMLRDKKGVTKIDYTFVGADEEGVIPTAEDRVDQLNELFAPSIADGTLTIDVSDSQIAGRDAKKVVMVSHGKADAYLETYFISVSTGVMTFTCACEFEDGGKYDFKAILDTIEYRI